MIITGNIVVFCRYFADNTKRHPQVSLRVAWPPTSLRAVGFSFPGPGK